MAQTSIGFNGSISAAQWAANAPLLLDGADATGGPTECVVSAVSGQRAVSVSAGRIGGDGIVTALSAAETVALPTPTNGQWFLLVENRVWSTGSTSLLLRNGATTSATFGFMPPAAFPASTTANPGTNSDIPVAWLWANSSSTSVYIFPLLLPTDRAYPRQGTSAVRSTVLSPSFPTAPQPYSGIWAQALWPLWSLDQGEYQQYIGAYDATLNPAGKATAGWTVVGQQSNPLRYDSEGGVKNGGNALAQYGNGGMAYARDTQGLYYRRGDARIVRLDTDTFVVVDATSSIPSGTTPRTTGDNVSRYSSSDTAVFPVRSDGVIGPIAVPGWYYVNASAAWNSDSGQTFIEVTINDTAGGVGVGIPSIADRRVANNNSNQQTVGGYLSLSAGDFIKLKSWQDSGGARSVITRLSARLARPINP